MYADLLYTNIMLAFKSFLKLTRSLFLEKEGLSSLMELPLKIMNFCDYQRLQLLYAIILSN